MFVFIKLSCTHLFLVAFQLLAQRCYQCPRCHVLALCEKYMEVFVASSANSVPVKTRWRAVVFIRSIWSGTKRKSACQATVLFPLALYSGER